MGREILVIGSTGTVGSRLAAALARRGETVRCATRKPEAAARCPGGAGRLVPFDLERPETYAAALAGVDRVFLMARPGDEHSDRLALPLVDEMLREGGVEHVVDLSAMGAEERPDFALRRVEVHLESSGMAFTHLRPNFFMQVFTTGSLLASIRAAGLLALPAADARLSFVDAGDVAEVAAVALTDPRHRGRAYTLTGGEALSHERVAQSISEATGRTVTYRPVDENAARFNLRASGFPPEWVERLVGFYRLVRMGLCSPVSPDVEAVLGRPPVTFREFARENAGCWARS
jgi:uncharacterized protein YbjT (DUF2867 family)